jgi:NhaP-type Na+/H+ or K+/H+ antiporter
MSGQSVVPDVVFFVAFSLFLSLIIIDLKKKVKVPITIMMVISGCFLRCVAEILPYQTKGYILADDIDNNLLLFVFIPPLIFETALYLEWYTFKKQFIPILLLATTGVYISTILISLATALVYIDHDYSYKTYLALGVILSATDHVFAVAQLNEHHVESRLSTLIQGETLMNDASVLVILTLINEFDSSDGHTLIIGVEHFFSLTLGGFILGLVFSVILIIWLKNMINEPIREVNATIVMTYLAFYCADGAGLHFSGAIAVATIGLAMSAFGKTVVSPNSEAAMHTTWTLLSRNNEFLIYMISGMIFAKDILFDDLVAWDHYLRNLVVFLLCYICRIITMTIHYPILKRLGYGLKFKEFILLCFSGLKGSITIILALLTRTSDLDSGSGNQFIIVACLQITMLSILIDPFLLSKIVSFFKLGKISIVQESLLVQVSAALVQETYQEIQKLGESEDGKFSDWNRVHEVTGSKKIINSLFSITKVGKKILKDFEDSQNESEFELIKAFSNEVKLEPDQILTELRRRFLTMMKGIFWHTFEEGQCFRTSLLNCNKAANISLDYEDQPLKTWKELKNLILPKYQFKFLKLGSKAPGIKKFCKKQLYIKLAEAYDSANCFIHAHREATHFLKSMPFYFDDYQYHIFTVLQESYEEIEACKKTLLHHITSAYPEILRYVQTYKSCHSVLNVQRKLIEKLMHHGLINDVEYENLSELLDNNLKDLNYVPKIPGTYDMLRGIFPNISEDICRKLAENTSEVVLNEGDFLFKKGDNAQGAFIVLKGCTREYADNFEELQAIGSISGVQHLIPSFRTNITTSRAITTTIAFKIRMDSLEMSPDFERELWMKAASKLPMIYKHDFGSLFEGMDHETITKFISECKFARYKNAEKVKVRSGGLLLNGDLDIFKAYHFIFPGIYQELVSNGNVVFMHLPKKLLKHMKETEQTCNMAIQAFMTKEGVSYDLILPTHAIPTNEILSESNSKYRTASINNFFTKPFKFAKFNTAQVDEDLSAGLLSAKSINL